MARKRVPHHNLSAVQAKFCDVASLEITRTATRSAQALGYSLGDVVAVVQALEPRDFVKSETAPNPVNSKVWHDSYRTPCAGRALCRKLDGKSGVSGKSGSLGVHLG